MGRANTVWLNLAGGVLLLAYAAQTVVSYWLAPAQVAYAEGPAFAGFYPSLTGVEVVPALQSWSGFALAYAPPLLVATAVCAAVLLQLYRGEVAEKLPRLAYLWAVAFAVVSLPAMPVLVQDFWISAAWGEMISRGLNPYHADIPPEIAAAWYPDSYLMRMTYGPLWGLISAAVMFLAEDRWAAFVLFKLVLGGFWLAALEAVRRLTSDTRSRTLALVMVGWLPVGVGQTLAEGHNDIAMAALVLVWLLNRNAVTLAASVLMKYVTAPLGLLVLLDRRKPLEIIAAAIFGLVVIGLFFRGPEMLASTQSMTAWHFMRPADALAFLGALAGAAALPFAALAAVSVWRHWKAQTDESRIKAAVSILALVMFAVLPHLWPWYFPLVLLPAAAAPLWRPSVWITGLALTAPFWLIVVRGRGPDFLAPWPALTFYALSILWLLAGLRVSSPSPRTSSARPERSSSGSRS